MHYLPDFLSEIKRLADCGMGWEDIVVRLDLNSVHERSVRRIVLEHPVEANTGRTGGGGGAEHPGRPTLTGERR